MSDKSKELPGIHQFKPLGITDLPPRNDTTNIRLDPTLATPPKFDPSEIDEALEAKIQKMIEDGVYVLSQNIVRYRKLGKSLETRLINLTYKNISEDDTFMVKQMLGLIQDDKLGFRGLETLEDTLLEGKNSISLDRFRMIQQECDAFFQRILAIADQVSRIESSR